MTEPDGITRSVIVNSFRSYCTEVSTSLLQTARSETLSKGHDFSVALADANCSLLAGGAGVPCHLASIDLCLEAMVDSVGTVEPGDVLLTNDPYEGMNTHLADFTLARPVFGDERPVVWVVIRAHQADIGAIDPASMATSAEHIYHEGLRIPPLKLVEGGNRQESILDLIAKNARSEQVQRGDVLAMVGAAETGVTLVENLIDKYGTDAVDASGGQLLGRTESGLREFAASLPAGTYEGTGRSDTNPETREPVTIRATVTVDGDSLVVDFDGTDGQVEGVTNNSLAVTHSAVNGAWVSIADIDFPLNAGAFRMVDVRAPEGTIVNPDFPAGTAYATITSYQETVEAVWDAFREIYPAGTPAGYARMVRPNISGRTDDGSHYSQLELNTMGGGGAIEGCDGPQSVAGTVGFRGGTAIDPEIQEQRLPLFFHDTDLRTDSGGAGRFRGGVGPTLRISPVGHEAVFSVGGDFGQTSPPTGHRGGADGEPPEVYTEDRDGTRSEVPHAFVNVELGDGETYVQRSGGGGGVGDPFERPVEAVERDSRNGYISESAAREQYGVVIEDGEVDHEATDSLRGSR